MRALNDAYDLCVLCCTALGCLGEVAIREDEEDYAKWAISIKVAFRDGESLAELTSHRQSGGVR